MGKSNSIEDQQKKNEGFQTYTNMMKAEMEKQTNAMESKIEEMVKEHYKSYSDNQNLLKGQYNHLTTISEWSLKSVNQIITLCAKTILGSKAPEGSEKAEQKETTSKAILAMKERNLFMQNEVFEAIEGILTCFESKTSTTVELVYQQKPIAPGITLFIGVAENSYAHKDFFNAETIVQTMYVYRIMFSLKEGLMQSKLSDLECYENQKVVYRKLIEQQNEVVAQIDITSDGGYEKLMRISNITDYLVMRLDGIGDKIEKLALGENSLSRAALKRELKTDNTKWKTIGKEIAVKKDEAYIEWSLQRNNV